MTERRQTEPLAQARPVELVAERAVPDEPVQLLARDRPIAFCAHRIEEGMEPDDLLCSRNARSRTPLVGRAQWKINQPHP